MRTLKDPDVRRAEILDAAEELFTTKGYTKTTVMDILNAVAIAKGTFYYYFKSKEEVMDGVITRMVESDALAARQVLADPGLSPVEKLHRILLHQQVRPGDHRGRMLDQFHHPSNAEMHQKSLILGIRSMAPIFTQIVEEGIALGIFHTPHPAETMEFLLVSGQILFDEGLFQWDPAERASRAAALVHIMETCLGAESGSFGFIGGLMTGSP